MVFQFLKTALAAGTIALVAACTTTPVSPSDRATTDLTTRTVIVHTARTIRNNWGPDRLFALVAENGGAWELLGVQSRYPVRRDQQEVFLITRDLVTWETTIAPHASCDGKESAYSVCSSILATSTFLGGKQYDKDAVLAAINSIPEIQAKAVLANYIEAEKSRDIRAKEEKIQQQALCYKNYDAETIEIDKAAGKAMAAAIAGKRLNQTELATIEKQKLRGSVAFYCGFTSPKS